MAATDRRRAARIGRLIRTRLLFEGNEVATTTTDFSTTGVFLHIAQLPRIDRGTPVTIVWTDDTHEGVVRRLVRPGSTIEPVPGLAVEFDAPHRSPLTMPAISTSTEMVVLRDFEAHRFAPGLASQWTSQRRDAARHPTRQEITWSSADSLPMRGVVLNVSDHGFYIQSRNEPHPGTPIHFRFPVGDAPGQFVRVTARVVRLWDPARELYPGFAARIQTIDDMGRTGAFRMYLRRLR